MTDEAPSFAHRGGEDSLPPTIFICTGDSGRACQRLNDLWQLDTTSTSDDFAEWQCIETRGPKPEPRSNAAASLSGRNLYVFGGWNLYGEGPVQEKKEASTKEIHIPDVASVTQVQSQK